MNTRFVCAALTALTFLTTVSEFALADPLPNQIPKFAQFPLNGEPNNPNGGPATFLRPGGIPVFPAAPFAGHDELSTAHLIFDPDGTTKYSGRYMADDFADNYNTPVVHVQWWGSYLSQPTVEPNSVQRFLISFESDVAAGPSATNPFPFSHPGLPLLNQVVTVGAPAPGFFQEAAIPTAAGSVDGQLYQYNAELAIPFDQLKDTVYWLKIVALDDHLVDDPAAIQWGWHDRDYGIFDPLASPVVLPGERLIGPVGLPDVWHFQDDAVTGAIDVQFDLAVPPSTLLVHQGDQYFPQNYLPGIDIPTFYPNDLSKDLAFVLYTIPEPGSLVLLGMSGIALLLFKRRRVR
jgi:hypothetical protein